MGRVVAVVGLALGVMLWAWTPSSAAEFLKRPAAVQTLAGHGFQPCRYVPICGPAGCSQQVLCRPAYSDAYLGHSLYGAYGPYGGTLYWGGYTAAGWGLP